MPLGGYRDVSVRVWAKGKRNNVVHFEEIPLKIHCIGQSLYMYMETVLIKHVSYSPS